MLLALLPAGPQCMTAAALTSWNCACCRRPVYTRQEWEDALQEDGSIAGFDEIVEEIELRVSLAPCSAVLALGWMSVDSSITSSSSPTKIPQPCCTPAS